MLLRLPKLVNVVLSNISFYGKKMYVSTMLPALDKFLVT